MLLSRIRQIQPARSNTIQRMIKPGNNGPPVFSSVSSPPSVFSLPVVSAVSCQTEGCSCAFLSCFAVSPLPFFHCYFPIWLFYPHLSVFPDLVHEIAVCHLRKLRLCFLPGLWTVRDLSPCHPLCLQVWRIFPARVLLYPVVVFQRLWSLVRELRILYPILTQDMNRQFLLAVPLLTVIPVLFVLPTRAAMHPVLPIPAPLAQHQPALAPPARRSTPHPRQHCQRHIPPYTRQK